MTAPGLIVLRFAAPLFFANGTVFDEAVRKAVTAAGRQFKHVVIDLEAVTDIDVTASENVASTLGWLKSKNIQVHYSRLRPDLRTLFDHYDLLADTVVYGSNRAAIAAIAALATPEDGVPRP